MTTRWSPRAASGSSPPARRDPPRTWSGGWGPGTSSDPSRGGSKLPQVGGGRIEAEHVDPAGGVHAPQETPLRVEDDAARVAVGRQRLPCARRQAELPRAGPVARLL